MELERLTGEGQTLIERRDAMEFFRDQAAEHFERHTGSAWRPRSGSMLNRRTMTAAMIDMDRCSSGDRPSVRSAFARANGKVGVFEENSVCDLSGFGD